MLCLHSRKDDWADKRMAMDDRYNRSDFGRQERYQDFDHRDRGRYQDDMMMDRRDSRGMGGNRDGQVRGRPQGVLTKNKNKNKNRTEVILIWNFYSRQHFSDRGDRHGRDSRDSWSGGFDKRMNSR